MGIVDGIGDRPLLKFSASPELPAVMIVSSVLLYREGLAASLAADGRLAVVSVIDPAQATAQAAALRPNAVVFDASGQEALAMARRLKQLDDGIVLVGFGISNSAQHVVACAEAGLAGFIDENGSIDALVQAIVGALQGEFNCSPRVTAILCERLASLASRDDCQTADPKDLLTPREREIALLVSEGLSNKEIALGLRIGPATVKNHVHNILDKLRVRRRAAIAAKVTETL